MSLANGFVQTNQHARMASPRALDVFSQHHASPRDGGGVGDAPTEDVTNEQLAALLRQRDDDARTAYMQAAEQSRRAAADEELRVAHEIAAQKVSMMQQELMGEAIPTTGTYDSATSPGGDGRAASRAAGATHTAMSARISTPRVVPSSPHPARSVSRAHGGRTPNFDHLRKIQTSPRVCTRSQDEAPPGNSHTRDTHPSQLVPYPPAVDSLSVMLPSLIRDSKHQPPPLIVGGFDTPHHHNRTSSRCAPNPSPAPPSRGGVRSTTAATSAVGASPRHLLVDDALRPGDPSSTFLPQSFSASHFQSIVKWAEMSYQEALVAQQAAATGGGGVCPGPPPSKGNSQADNKGMATPATLMTTACCAIVDEVLLHVPGFRHVWEAMRMEIFGAIFKLDTRDVDAGVGTSYRGSVPPAPSVEPEQRSVVALPAVVPPVSRFAWFSQVCARRALWYHAAREAEARGAQLTEALGNIKVSLEKYDRIFDIFDRTMDRVVIERSFRAWRTTASRHRQQCKSLLSLVIRKEATPLITTAFHSWRRIVMQRNLKSSKDKDATLTAVHEARLKTKAAELERLQARLEGETRRLQLHAEKEARKNAALSTSHAAEVRELTSCQNAKDEVILSLEKIAKRWERIAKTFRPTLSRQPIPSAVLMTAKGLHEAETELAGRGPSTARLLRCKEELERLMCVWVNSTLDSISSKAPRLKNCTSDVRDGEALAALCRHLIGRSGSGMGPNSTPFNTTVVGNSLHAVVTRALYLSTSQGMCPLLLSSCPFASKLFANEQHDAFLASPHPTAGLWILASLFVAEMLQTGHQIPDASSVRYGCAVEDHVRQSTVHALMLTDRLHHHGEYSSLRRDSMRAAYQRLEWMGEAVVASPGGERCATGSGVDDGMNDTASDTAAYMGGSEGEDDTPLAAPQHTAGATGSQRSSHSHWDQLEQATSSVCAASSSDDEDGQHRGQRIPHGGDPDALPDMRRGTVGRTTSPRPFASFSSSPLPQQDQVSPTAVRSGKLGDAPFSSGSHFIHESISSSSGTSRPSFSTGTPQGSIPRPSFIVHGAAGSGATPTTPSTSEETKGAIARLPPVRSDLRTLPMHALVRKLRSETKQTESWRGLARLVSSVVLRFRVLDQDAPVKGRTSVVAADEPPPATVGPPSTDAPISRTPSMSSVRGSVAHAVVPRGSGAVPPPPAASGVPRSSTSTGGGASGAPGLRRSSGASRSAVQRGSMFFASDAPSTSSNASPVVASMPAPGDAGGASGRRSTLVKFE